MRPEGISQQDIPRDIDQAASRIAGAFLAYDVSCERIYKLVVAALIAERERCAVIADEREAICAEAVALVEAGKLYADIPTAYASENSARMEASHIARLIREEPTRKPQNDNFKSIPHNGEIA